MPLHVLPGEAGLSEFRLQRLLTGLQALAPALRSIEAREFFLVQGEALEPAALHRLLGTDSARARADERFFEAEADPDAQAVTLFVVPRLGTLSPWSSKATDIARVCGLAGVTRIERGWVYRLGGVDRLGEAALLKLYDPMTESLLYGEASLQGLFTTPARRPLRVVDVLGLGAEALQAANQDWGLALSDEEIDYLAHHAKASGRNPSDAELMMFAQVNSEHCRHKIFNAEFTLDGVVQPHSLFEMIRLTHAATPGGVLSAYKDNAAVVEGPRATRWFPGGDRIWSAVEEPVHLLMKVETHNHPTGISPHAGAATGAGGEIRDEAATGLGGKPKAGLCGFAVANLRLPGFEQPWEADLSRPPRVASALSIMIEGPLGAAAYNNEFGRPNLAGTFRTFEALLADGRNLGYHKPIMIAGGYGNVRPGHVAKREVPPGAALVVLGGPALLIGLGGGAASSMATGASSAELDFASVQRANPELERRCQEVVDACWALGEANPILSIHDVGAGGLSNALPELVHADGRGARLQLRDIPSADPSLSPMEIWCNEAQERYVLALAPQSLGLFAEICERERCPYARVGVASAEDHLSVADADSGTDVVNLPMPVLLGKPPQLKRQSQRLPGLAGSEPGPGLDIQGFDEAVQRLLRLPAVASKKFLITIGDRTVGGLTVRDQMVGPWQVPVADCAVTATGFTSITGEAMAMGERPLLALIDAAASARMAVGEALTNLAAAHIARLSDVRLSANWMAASGQGDEDARLFDAVKAVGAELCPKLGIAIPVGKDSLSMKSVWTAADGSPQLQTAPLSLVVSAFAPVTDVRRTLTPQLRTDLGPTALILIDLGNRRNRLGGSALGQVFGHLGGIAPDLDHPEQLAALWALTQTLNGPGDRPILASHDRSDGGLFITLAEMAFAGRAGVDIELDALGPDPVASLFCEELGVVWQVAHPQAQRVLASARDAGLTAEVVGHLRDDGRIRVRHAGQVLFEAARSELHRQWAETSYRIAALRDAPDCALEEFETEGQDSDPGLVVKLSFQPQGVEPLGAPALALTRPRVAILREQGVNGQAEMAFGFDAAGFEAVDVHMSELLSGRVALDGFIGLAACGGFSYGDVLGAGQGWAKTILFNTRARDGFQGFFTRPETFALGVCNGCQTFSALKALVPGAEAWPAFRRNRSEQFEARWSQVEIAESRSVLFTGMAGSCLPIAVSHGEGRAEFASPSMLDALSRQGQITLRFTDAQGRPATRYPANPNGSAEGITGVCNADGRVTLLMPHPERSLHGVTGSWWPNPWPSGKTPWFRLFENARRFVG